MKKIIDIINEEIYKITEMAIDPLNKKRGIELRKLIKKIDPNLKIVVDRGGGRTTYWLEDKSVNNGMIISFSNDLQTSLGQYTDEEYDKIVNLFIKYGECYKKSKKILNDINNKYNLNLELRGIRFVVYNNKNITINPLCVMDNEQLNNFINKILNNT